MSWRKEWKMRLLKLLWIKRKRQTKLWYLFTRLFIYRFILFFAQSQNGLKFALPASIVYWHKVHPFGLCRKILMMFIYGAYYYNARVHIGIYKKKMENVKSSANPLFLILFFINLRNNILHEYKYLGRYFGLYKKKINDKKYEAIWREKKIRMYHFCCICIYRNIYWNMSYY